jgi:hypothetical protein
MKNHKRFKELIQGYLDKALSDKERQDLENHLKSCEECKEELKRRKNLLEELRSAKEEIQCPDYLINNILKDTIQKESPAIISTFKIRWKYIAVSAAAVLIVISTVLLNTENNKRMLTTTKSQEIREEEAVEGVKIPGSAELPLHKKELEVRKIEKHTMASSSGTDKTTTTSLPEEKVGFAETEKIKEVPLVESSADFAKTQETPEEISTISKKAAAPSSKKVEISRIRKTQPVTGYSESTLAGHGVPEENFKETRFIFPEEGSVVGKDFEIVLILKNPEETIEISLDGEKITNYTKEKDSNVIFIGSDSIFPLEEGLHYLSLKTKEDKSITFYKEG